MCLTTLSIESAPSTWQQDSCPLPRCHGTSTSYQRPLQLIERLFVVSGKNQPCVAHCTHDRAFCKISTYQHDHLCDVVCSEVHCTAVPQHHTRLLQRAAQLIRLLRILRRPTVTGRQVKREYELLRCCMDRSPPWIHTLQTRAYQDMARAAKSLNEMNTRVSDSSSSSWRSLLTFTCCRQRHGQGQLLVVMCMRSSACTSQTAQWASGPCKHHVSHLEHSGSQLSALLVGCGERPDDARQLLPS